MYVRSTLCLTIAINGKSFYWVALVLLTMKKTEILAVHKQKLENFLKKLELWEPLSRGALKCAVCGVTISIDNIGLIIPSGNEIVVCCSNAECVFRLKELRGEANES